MPTIASADGTGIAYERSGSGPALVLVDGAMCFRAAGPMRPLAALLSEHFAVYCYDRRGRGESGDAETYDPRREREDLAAVIAAAGGSAAVYAMSSGGAIALAAAASDCGVTAVALYEPPFLPPDPAYTAELTARLAAGRRGDAVALFMAKVGMPPPAIAGFRASPAFATLEAIAPTLAYDDALLAAPIPAAVPVPAVLISGSSAPAVVELPGAAYERLEGQTHDVDPAVLAPVLIKYLG
jgi:pimeloyl-ACP methyl ester carboxylesterase